MDKKPYTYGAGIKIQQLLDELRFLCALHDEEHRDLRTQEKVYLSRYEEELARGCVHEELHNSLETENDKLRAQLAEQTNQVRLLNGIVTGLHYQVTMARNSALLDVEQAVQAMYPKYGGAALDDIRTAIHKLRQKEYDVL